MQTPHALSCKRTWLPFGPHAACHRPSSCPSSCIATALSAHTYAVCSSCLSPVCDTHVTNWAPRRPPTPPHPSLLTCPNQHTCLCVPFPHSPQRPLFLHSAASHVDGGTAAPVNTRAHLRTRMHIPVFLHAHVMHVGLPHAGTLSSPCMGCTRHASHHAVCRQACLTNNTFLRQQHSQPIATAGKTDVRANLKSTGAGAGSAAEASGNCSAELPARIQRSTAARHACRFAGGLAWLSVLRAGAAGPSPRARRRRRRWDCCCC